MSSHRYIKVFKCLKIYHKVCHIIDWWCCKGKTLNCNPFLGGEIATTIVLKILVGPLFGLMMGYITIFWLVNIFNDALAEITITLASTYVTFYICEYES